MSDLANLLRHARLYGTECVYETASNGLSEAERIRLRIELDAIERERKGRHRRPARRKGKAEATREAVQLLFADGLNAKAIANKLSLSDRTVRRYLADTNARGQQELIPASETRSVERGIWPKLQSAGNDTPGATA